MEKQNLWNLFKETGDLRYYVFLKEMEKVEENYYENRKSNRNSTK